MTHSPHQAKILTLLGSLVSFGVFFGIGLAALSIPPLQLVEAQRPAEPVQRTATPTPPPLPTVTPTPVATPTRTPLYTPTIPPTPTRHPTFTPTPTPRRTSTRTPTFTPTLRATRTPTSTRTPTVSPTITPTVPPCPYDVYSFTVERDWLNERGGAAWENYDPNAYGTSVSCLGKLIESYRQNVASFVEAGRDDGIANQFATNFCGSSYTKAQSAPTMWGNRCSWTTHYGATGTIVTSFTVYFDASCSPVQKPALSTASCDTGFYEWRHSPISLLWRDGYDIASTTSFSQFPLQPGAQSRTYRWYASAEAPLLVWDPEQRGEIRDGTQLFGHWTFGGQRLASINSTGATSRRTQWRDGYEALGTLDYDGDGEIAGAEMKNLALWFDENRDGVSQRGEVRTLAAAGVTKLFYTPDQTDARGHIYARRGFERVDNGTRYTGASVDWFAEGETDKLSLVNKLITESTLSPRHRVGSLDALQGLTSADKVSVSPLIPNNDSTTAIARNGGVPLSGIWEWQMTGAITSQQKSYLTLHEDATGTITGHSLLEIPLKAGQIARGAVQIAPLVGKRVGNDSVSFRVTPGGDSQTSLQTTVKIVGAELHGTTTVSQLEGTTQINFSYDWVATRK